MPSASDRNPPSQTTIAAQMAINRVRYSRRNSSIQERQDAKANSHEVRVKPPKANQPTNHFASVGVDESKDEIM